MIQHAQRVVETLQSLGYPLDGESLNELATARRNENVAELERILDRFAICTVTINPESRVKVLHANGGSPKAKKEFEGNGAGCFEE